jgi:hypothetical protein
LYRLKDGGRYRTFEAYCKGAWGLSKGEASRLIDEADTFALISSICKEKAT